MSGKESREKTQIQFSGEEMMKYRTAADITNLALTTLLPLCTTGQNIEKLCELADKLIETQCQKYFSKKSKGDTVRKGIAFPTCISVNEIIGNFSPVNGEEILQENDLIKMYV